MSKHHLLKVICDKQNEKYPEQQTLYKGAIPSTINVIHTLTAGKLRAIFKAP